MTLNRVCVAQTQRLVVVLPKVDGVTARIIHTLRLAFCKWGDIWLWCAVNFMCILKSKPLGHAVGVSRGFYTQNDIDTKCANFTSHVYFPGLLPLLVQCSVFCCVPLSTHMFVVCAFVTFHNKYLVSCNYTFPMNTAELQPSTLIRGVHLCSLQAHYSTYLELVLRKFYWWSVSAWLKRP